MDPAAQRCEPAAVLRGGHRREELAFKVVGIGGRGRGGGLLLLLLHLLLRWDGLDGRWRHAVHVHHGHVHHGHVALHHRHGLRLVVLVVVLGRRDGLLVENHRVVVAVHHHRLVLLVRFHRSVVRYGR